MWGVCVSGGGAYVQGCGGVYGGVWGVGGWVYVCCSFFSSRKCYYYNMILDQQEGREVS